MGSGRPSLPSLLSVFCIGFVVGSFGARTMTATASEPCLQPQFLPGPHEEIAKVPNCHCHTVLWPSVTCLLLSCQPSKSSFQRASVDLCVCLVSVSFPFSESPGPMYSQVSLLCSPHPPTLEGGNMSPADCASPGTGQVCEFYVLYQRTVYYTSLGESRSLRSLPGHFVSPALETQNSCLRQEWLSTRT